MHAQYCGSGVAIVPNNERYGISVSPLMFLKTEILLDVTLCRLVNCWATFRRIVLPSWSGQSSPLHTYWTAWSRSWWHYDRYPFTTSTRRSTLEDLNLPLAVRVYVTW